LDDVFSELRSTPKRPALKSPPNRSTLVTTASPLPAGMSPAAVIDLTALAI